ncbi:MAG: sulfotransferase [Leptolyngbyaceae cyanobacterium]
MTLPNFLIIGSAKGGTSSLHYYLRQHPQIFMPDLKEPRFFALEGGILNFQNPDSAINYNSITTLREYESLFANVTNELGIGEASPLYLYSEKAARRIKHYVPDAKLMVILRNPVDRAFSCYTHLLREGYETLSFEAALKAESERRQNNWAHLWHYREAGYYYRQLKPYFELFNPEQIKIYLFDEFKQDNHAVLTDIYDFLGVDRDFVPDMTRQNVSGMPKSRRLQKFFSQKNVFRSTIQAVMPKEIRHTVAAKIKAWNIGKKPKLNPETRHQLMLEYRDDILQLQTLIAKDLTSWIQ